MPEGKNQHYVPQHVLRGWAERDDRIEVFHLPSERQHKNLVRRVCSDNYLYSHHPMPERELGKLESEHAQPINRLRDGATLADLEPEMWRRLCSFVTTQRSRTKSVREDIRASAEDEYRDAIEDVLRAGRYDDLIVWREEMSRDEQIEALVDGSIRSLHHFLMVHGIYGYYSIRDLDAVMLRNVTENEFIISDAPVVHDNPQFRQSRNLVSSGLSNRGLQIYCPVCPDRLLLLYDPMAYKYTHNSKRQVLVKEADTVDELNLLQFHHADSIVMSSSSDERYLRELHGRRSEFWRRDTVAQVRTTESGKSVEISREPHDQIPKQSPTLPTQVLRKGVSFSKRRPASGDRAQREIVHRIFQKTRNKSDVALIYAIRAFPGLSL